MASTKVVAPNDEALLYDQFWSMERQTEQAVFHRCFDPQFGCDPPAHQNYGREYHYHPGARVSLLTDAQRVLVLLEYGVSCRASCAGTPPNYCYHPRPGQGFMHGTCTNHCQPKLYVDGRVKPLPAESIHSDVAGGNIEALLLFDHGVATQGRLQKVELVMPWGGEVRVRGFELHRMDGAVPSLMRPPESPFRFIAYGDSITQGYCSPTPYPEFIGRKNGWNAINLGIGGLKTSPQHGIQIGQARADLVLMFIGTNDWWGSCDITSAIGDTIANVRSGSPQVPLVVVTMLARADEPKTNPKRCIVLEDLRQQIRNEVRRRQRAGDTRLYLVEGKPLLSISRLGDGLHPGSDAAMAELASNLNAQMGFSSVQYSAVQCRTTQLVVEAWGLTPNSTSWLHVGEGPLSNAVLEPPCHEWSVMIGGATQIRATSDADGRARFIARVDNCALAVFQIVDTRTCTVSRTAHASDQPSTRGTAAENFAPQSPSRPHPNEPRLPPPYLLPSSPVPAQLLGRLQVHADSESPSPPPRRLHPPPQPLAPAQPLHPHLTQYASPRSPCLSPASPWYPTHYVFDVDDLDHSDTPQPAALHQPSLSPIITDTRSGRIAWTPMDVNDPLALAIIGFACTLALALAAVGLQSIIEQASRRLYSHPLCSQHAFHALASSSGRTPHGRASKDRSTKLKTKRAEAKSKGQRERRSAHLPSRAQHVYSSSLQEP